MTALILIHIFIIVIFVRKFSDGDFGKVSRAIQCVICQGGSFYTWFSVAKTAEELLNSIKNVQTSINSFLPIDIYKKISYFVVGKIIDLYIT